jgi:putative tryptophan/tyrosine transport system substrate-binding protein
MKRAAVPSILIGVTLLAVAVIAEAQQAKKVPRIGYLISGSPSSTREIGEVEAFRQGLRELGYVEGQNIAIEYRYAEGVDERLLNLATELVQLNVDLIFVSGTIGTQAAKNATQTIPIVMTSVTDPVGTGLVSSLAHPGGNVTGLSNLSELSGKQLELLKEAFPKITRVAVLWDPANTANARLLGEMKVAGGGLRITLQPLEVNGPDDFQPAFSAIKKERASALIVLRNVITYTYGTRIVDLTAKSKLPAMYPDRVLVDTGGLMSYGPNFLDMFHRAATYVDKILKGAKPVDLPVEQPTKFEFIVNLKTAKQLGLTIPPNVLARADKVIK